MVAYTHRGALACWCSESSQHQTACRPTQIRDSCRSPSIGLGLYCAMPRLGYRPRARAVRAFSTPAASVAVNAKATIRCLCLSVRLLRHVRRQWALLSFHSVCLSVGHSATYSLTRLIDHNQIWSADIYLSSDPCKPFWIPYLPYFRCQREKYAKFRLFPTRRQWVMPYPTRPTIRDRVC